MLLTDLKSWYAEHVFIFSSHLSGNENDGISFSKQFRPDNEWGSKLVGLLLKNFR